MSLLGSVEASIVVPTGGYAFTLDETGVGTAAITIAAGTGFFWTAVGLEGTPDGSGFGLRERIEDELNTNSPDSATYTVTLSSTADNATGKLTISTDGPNFRLTSVTADFLSLAGFTSASIGAYAASHTSNDGQVKALWLPDCAMNAQFGLNTYGMPESQTVPMVAPDGTFSVFHGQTMTRNRIWFEMITKARAVAGEETVTNESYEQFWTDAIRGEAAWAVASTSFLVRGDRNGGTARYYHVVAPGRPDMSRISEEHDLYYRVTMDLLKRV